MQKTTNLVIDTLLGTNNILIVIPHAHRENTDVTISPLMTAGRMLAGQLHCYCVINGKYKPSIIDMNDVRALCKRKKTTDDFLLRIKQFKDEISENNLLPLVLILRSAEQSLDADIVFGYGQGERGRDDRPHRPTIAPSLLAKIRMAMEDNGFSTTLAETASNLCGRESFSLNQLFRQKNYLSGFYDPTVRSLLLTIQADKISDDAVARTTASRLAQALTPFADSMSLVRRVAVDAIDTDTIHDMRYIFRVYGDNRQNDIINTSYINDLARSIDRNGLLHPLVLLQKRDGRYKILCGFRRLQAIRLLGRKWVEAKTFSEDDFSTEDFFNISLAENTKRRNLNPIEIGNFLESASRELSLNNARLAEQFGESLGIGKPGAKVSQSTIHKYRKLYRIRERHDSPEMIADIINDKLQFSIAAEVLAPIKDTADRDSLYLEIVKPLAPTRPQLLQIVKLLQSIHPRLSIAVADPLVRKSLEKAVNGKHKATTFINALRKCSDGKKAANDNHSFAQSVAALRKDTFGSKAKKADFNITRPGKQSDSLTLHIRLQKQSMQETIDKLRQMLNDEERLQELQKLLK